LPEAPDGEECVLDDILGVGGVAEDSGGDAEPVAAAAGDEMVEIFGGAGVQMLSLSIDMMRRVRGFV
jgi:hypothetical protein